MKIDTEIRHVTKPGANLFLELGFPPEEAKRLHQASQQQINDTKQLKEQLMAELAAWIEQHHDIPQGTDNIRLDLGFDDAGGLSAKARLHSSSTS